MESPSESRPQAAPDAPPPNRPPATKDAAARRELERAKAIVARWTID